MSDSGKIIAAVVVGLIVIGVAWLLFWGTPGVSTATPPATSTSVQTPPPATTAPPAATAPPPAVTTPPPPNNPPAAGSGRNGAAPASPSNP